MNHIATIITRITTELHFLSNGTICAPMCYGRVLTRILF